MAGIAATNGSTYLIVTSAVTLVDLDGNVIASHDLGFNDVRTAPGVNVVDALPIVETSRGRAIAR